MVCRKEAQPEARKKALVVKYDNQNVRLHHGIENDKEPVSHVASERMLEMTQE